MKELIFKTSSERERILHTASERLPFSYFRDPRERQYNDTDNYLAAAKPDSNKRHNGGKLHPDDQKRIEDQREVDRAHLAQWEFTRRRSVTVPLFLAVVAGASGKPGYDLIYPRFVEPNQENFPTSTPVPSEMDRTEPLEVAELPGEVGQMGFRKYFSDNFLKDESSIHGENCVVRIGMQTTLKDFSGNPVIIPFAAYCNGEQLEGPPPTLVEQPGKVVQNCLTLEWFPTAETPQTTLVYTVSTRDNNGTETLQADQTRLSLFQPECYQLTQSPLSDQQITVFVEDTNGMGGFKEESTWSAVDTLLQRASPMLAITNLIIRDSLWTERAATTQNGDGIVLSGNLDYLSTEEIEEATMTGIAMAVFNQEVGKSKDPHDPSSQAVGAFLTIYNDILTNSQLTHIAPLMTDHNPAAPYIAVLSQLDHLFNEAPRYDHLYEPLKMFSRTFAAMSLKRGEINSLTNQGSKASEIIQILCGQIFRISLNHVQGDRDRLESVFADEAKYHGWMSLA